jgi:hypothetical protein
MMAFSRVLLVLLYLQGIESLLVNRHPTGTRLSVFRLSEKVLKEEEKLSVVINGMPGRAEEAQTNGQEINGYTMPSGQKKFGYSTTLKQNGPLWLGKLRELDRDDREMEEDGYYQMSRKKRSLFMKAVRLPIKVVQKMFSKKNVEPGTLILVRHGESEWNHNKTFTGWADPDLTDQGKREVEHAARLLMEGGYKIDVVFTSRLKRAIRSVWILLQELNETYLPVFKSWRMNERMYGALTGLCKIQTAETLGQGK